jgi:hypothetical protein
MSPPIRLPLLVEAIHKAIEVDQGAAFQVYFEAAMVENETMKPKRFDPTYLGGEFIGAGDIGSCARAIWYSFRWVTEKVYTAKSLLIFQRGQLEEARFAAMLRGIPGVSLWTHQAGKQFGAQVGPIKGKLDGVAKGLPGFDGPAVTEFKGHGESFSKLEREGVQKAKPEHYAQVQVYLHAQNLPAGLYLAGEKATENLYAERVDRDPPFVAEMQRRASAIVKADEPPPRIDLTYLCKYCDHRDICGQGEKLIEGTPRGRSCRTCVHSRFTDSAAMTCALSSHHEDVPHKAQFRGCERHRLRLL